MNKKISIGFFFDRPLRSYYLARELKKHGFSVTLYNTKGPSGSYQQVSYRISNFVPKLLFSKHDIYVTSASFKPSIALLFNKWLRRKPYVFILNGNMWDEFDDRADGRMLKPVWLKIYSFLLNLQLKNANYVICNSGYVREKLIRKIPELEVRSKVIYNGVELFAPEEKRQESNGFDGKGELNLVCIGTADYKLKTEGLKFILDIITMIPANKNVKLTMLVKCRNMKYENDLKQYFKQNCNTTHAQLLFNLSSVANILQKNHIFLYATPPESTDSLPRTLIEAQGFGLPTVTTNSNGCGEVVKDGVSGFVTPYNKTIYAQRVMELIDRPDLRKTMSKQAKKVKNIFKWENMAKGYAQVFEHIIYKSTI